MTLSALVVGLGSIGQRHLRLLRALGLDVAAVSRRQGVAERCYASIGEALGETKPGYVVIANETAAHRPALVALAEAGYSGTVLVEKPLFAAPAPLPAHRFAGLYVGYNLRFHPLLRAVQQLLAEEPAISAQIYVGQYLPEWRPGRDYRDTASAGRAAGGGVLRDLSHELDYMTWLFGPCRRVAALGGHLGPLAIETDDVQALLLSFARCPVATAQLNYLDRQGGRDIVINTASRTIRADFLRGTLRVNGEETRFAVARDETYLAQHRCALGNERALLCSAVEGLAVTELIAAAERAADGGAWVAP
jgi:predicted dehydrogenase